jgi:hypothetical protein
MILFIETMLYETISFDINFTFKNDLKTTGSRHNF